MRHLIMCIDIRTTGCRTVIFDEKGRQVSQSYQEYQSIYLSSRWIDHDPKTWLQATQKTVKEAIKKLEHDRNCLSAIAVTSQRATFIPVNKNGKPLDNAILWQDKRAIKETKHLMNEYGPKKIYDITGLRVDPYFTLPKLLWLKKNKTEIYNNSYIFLSVQDYIIHYLTGKFKTDWTQASRTMFFNINKLKWDKDFIKSVGINFTKLPEAVPPGSIIGFVNRVVSEELDLPKGIPVIAAGGDQQCAAIGLGVIKAGMVEVNTGTGSFVLADSDKPVKDIGQRLICSRWFRDNFGEIEMETQRESGIDAYKIMNSEAAKEPLGANGLLLIPHFAASAAPYWNPEARGILFGLSLGHKRSSIIRALLEGIAFEIQKNISIIENYKVYKELSKIHDSLYWSLEKAGIYSKMNDAMKLL